jgi:hypothetical protein
MLSEVDQQLIKSTFAAYFGHLALQEHEKAIAFLYPRLFKMISEKDLLSGLKKGVDKSVVTTLQDLNFKGFSSEVNAGKVKYVTLDYQFMMIMTFLMNEETEEDEDEDDDHDHHHEKVNKLEFTYEMLKAKYGKKNVSIDKEKQTLTAKISNQAYCISDPAYDGWKFLEKKEGVTGLLEKLLPK